MSITIQLDPDEIGVVMAGLIGLLQRPSTSAQHVAIASRLLNQLRQAESHLKIEDAREIH